MVSPVLDIYGVADGQQSILVVLSLLIDLLIIELLNCQTECRNCNITTECSYYKFQNITWKQHISFGNILLISDNTVKDFLHRRLNPAWQYNTGQ